MDNFNEILNTLNSTNKLVSDLTLLVTKIIKNVSETDTKHENLNSIKETEKTVEIFSKNMHLPYSDPDDVDVDYPSSVAAMKDEEVEAEEALNEAIKNNTEAEKISKPITIEELKSFLAKKAREGFAAEVKEIIKSYGCEKLSDVNSNYYSEILSKAQKLGVNKNE